MLDIVYCPRPSCQKPVILDRDSSMGSCPSCSFVFCALCKLCYHGVSPCTIKAGLYIILLYVCLFVCLMMFNATFNNVSVFIGGGNQRNPPTCRKSLKNFITYRKLGYFGGFLSKCGCLILVCLIFGAFQKMIVLFWCFSNGQKNINACDQCFFLS